MLKLERSPTMDTAVFTPQLKSSCGNHFVRIALTVSLTLLAATHASAQYGGGTGGGMSGGTGGGTYTAPSSGYGSGKAVGIGVGAAAGGAAVLFLALHNHGTMTGCLQPSDDGLRLVDEKKNTSYALSTGGVLLKAGQRVQLKGQKSTSDSGVQTFAAKKLVKDLGACSAANSVAQTQPTGR
jgi:hypothetical protein